MYKVGDKVRVVRTDFPSNIPVGSIKEVLVTGRNYVELSNGRTNGWTFFDHEVESYEEPIQSNQMNKYNLRVGDVLDTRGIPYHTLSANDEVVDINKTQDRLVLKVSGEWSIRSSNLRIEGDKWKIVSRSGKTQDKVKEIVGYKLKDDFTGKRKSVESAIAAELGHATYTLTVIDDRGNFTSDSMVANALKRLGVLDLWFTPIYKSEDVVLSISGNRKVTVVNDKATIAGVDSMSFLEVKFLYDTVNPQNKLGKHTLTIAQDAVIRVGCQSFTKQDIDTVYQALVKLQ